MNASDDRPGYSGFTVSDTATIAEILRQNGYNRGASARAPDARLGNVVAARLTAGRQVRGSKPSTVSRAARRTSSSPPLYQGTTPMLRPRTRLSSHGRPGRPGNHLDTHGTGRHPDKPFFVYFAPGGTTHRSGSAAVDEPYRGKFDSTGWDAPARTVFARQKALGVIPPGHCPDSPARGPAAWDSWIRRGGKWPRR